MRLVPTALFLALLSSVTFPAWGGELKIVEPWIRATPAVSRTTAAYLTLENHGTQVRWLRGASCPLSPRVELHRTVQRGEMMAMEPVEKLEIPVHGTVKLEPGGLHLMLLDLTKPPQEGEKVPLTLQFEDGASEVVEATVRRQAASVAGGDEHHH